MSTSNATTILIVDDNEPDRHFAAQVLGRAGFLIQEARTATEALARGREQPDLILLDVDLPDLSGFEVCRRLKADPATAHVPVLHLSAVYTASGDRSKGLEAGADGYLVKPVDSGELIAMVRALLRLRLAETEARTLARQWQTTCDIIITDRQRAEEEQSQRLRERAQLADHLRQMLEATAEGILSLDLEGRFTFVNGAGAQMLGYPAGDLLGKNMHDLVHHSRPDGTPRPRELCPLCQTLSLGTDCHVDTELFWNGEGQALPVEYLAHPILEGGAIRGAVVTFRDISRQKRLEAQFRQLQKMEAIGRLAAGVTHDFNNLLTVISGYSEFVLQGLEPHDPMSAPIQEIKKAGEKASALTSQLLAFCRKQPITPRPLILNEVIADMERLVRRLLGANVELIVNLQPGLGWVLADAGQLQQVLLNLITNGRDAMPQGGRVTIETGHVDLNETIPNLPVDARLGPHVLLAVSDTGSGMTEEVRSHLFEPFFTTKEPGRGTGLGLSTVYGIVKQSGGHISVYSEPGHGSTFKIYLPRLKQGAGERPEEAEQTEDSFSESVSPSVSSTGAGSETILVAEDDVVIAALISKVLRQRGYQVLEAMNGSAALQLGQDHPGPIHLLISDVVMPRLSGGELAQRLRILRPGLRVLHTSGHGNGFLLDQGEIRPDAAFLQKPFSPDRLLRKVREVLDHSSLSEKGDCPHEAKGTVPFFG